jgi:phosphoribosylformylglycinamidine cyclo-ligase
MARKPSTNLTYASAGVDIDQKDAFTESLETTMRRTFSDRVIANPGGFAGLFRLDYKKSLFSRNYKDPVLVACCDGVGTKISSRRTLASSTPSASIWWR